MKCPFNPGECLGRECPGWNLGRCFLEIFLQKMDNVSLKLDTLCNLASLAAASQSATGLPQSAEPPQPTDLDTEKEGDEAEGGKRKCESVKKEMGEPLKQQSGQDVLRKELEEPGNRPRLWNVPVVVLEHEKRDAPVGEDAAESTPCAANLGLERSVEEPLPVFPARVSEITFADSAEECISDRLCAAENVEAQELTLELTAVQDPASPDMAGGLAVGERVLLMSEPTNGTGTPDMVYDSIASDLRGDSQLIGLKEVLAEPLPDPMVEDRPAVDPEPASSAEDSSAEALSVEKVIDDITSVKGSVTAPPERLSRVEQAEAPPAPETATAQAAAGAKIVAEERLPGQPSEVAAEPPTLEEAEAIAEEQGVVVLEVTGGLTPETAGGSTEQLSLDTPVVPAEEELEAELAEPETSLDVLPAERDIDVSVVELSEPEQAATSEEPPPWEPIGLVEAKGGAALGVDFGAALSKVALKTDASTPATAIPLALIAYEVLHKADLVRRFESRNEYLEESLVYFDQNEFVFCGMLAKDLSTEAAASGQNRPAIQNLKTFLVRGGANLQIHSDFFPASESLDSQSVLAIYLAYLLRLTRHYLEKRTGKSPVDLDTTVRNFSIPTWIEERYREDVRRLFRGAAAYAFCLERWLKDDLIKGARLPDVRKALQEAREHKSNIEETLVGSIVTESAAAGHTRLLSLARERGKRPATVLVVNVGAGFTDFALFGIAQHEGQNPDVEAQVAYRGGVGTGLGVWDNALKTLLFNRVRETPAARKKVNEFRIFKARLELEAREIKETLMASEGSLSVDVSPVLPEPVSVERSELESSLPVKAALFGIRDGLRVFIKEAIKAVGMHRFDPGLTEIIVTGGGAFVPSVVDCIREAVATLGPAYPARVRADFVSPLYTSIPNIGSLYPLLAVSLGVTEKEYPDEHEQVITAQAAHTAAAAAPHSAAATARRPMPPPQVKMPAKAANRYRLT